MTQIEERELFGGAITGAVPQGWIDGRCVYSLILGASSVNLYIRGDTDY